MLGLSCEPVHNKVLPVGGWFNRVYLDPLSDYKALNLRIALVKYCDNLSDFVISYFSCNILLKSKPGGSLIFQLFSHLKFANHLSCMLTGLRSLSIWRKISSLH